MGEQEPRTVIRHKVIRQIRLDLLDGKTGLYLQVNSFKPQGGESHKAVPMANGGDDDGSDLPF